MARTFRRPAAVTFITVCLTLFAAATINNVWAQPPPQRLAVLDFHDSSAGSVKSQEVIYLSDLVRGLSRRALPADLFLLMTRENILELLPQGRSLADCVGDCAVETGRKIGADMVVTGEVTTFGGQLRVTVNLHEMKNGNLLGQVVAGAADVLGVESDLKAKVMELLVPLRNGWLTVIVTDQKANAVDAVINIDGREAGKAYQTITLLAGRHQVSVDGPAGSWTGEVVVEESKMVNLAARLVPLVQPAAVRPVSGTTVAMVEIPAGSFVMGSPSSEENRDSDEPQHRVEITQAFLLSSTEVTQAQYELVMGENPSKFKGDDLPVGRVSWLAAAQFCNKLSMRDGLSLAYRISSGIVTWDVRSNGYRLPTEAEWEYACRAGAETAYHTGGSESDLARAGWYSGNAGKEAHPVGEKTPNAWGLYDMHGNVWEWCWDWYGDYGSGSQMDPQGAARGSNRVIRGGSLNFNVRNCRSADRGRYDPANVGTDLGLRVARSSRQ